MTIVGTLGARSAEQSVVEGLDDNVAGGVSNNRYPFYFGLILIVYNAICNVVVGLLGLLDRGQRLPQQQEQAGTYEFGLA